jgi:NAD(P)H-flavin reductase
MKIMEKKVLSAYSGVKVTQMRLELPEIAKKAKPGQFLIIMVKPEGERIP